MPENRERNLERKRTTRGTSLLFCSDRGTGSIFGSRGLACGFCFLSSLTPFFAVVVGLYCFTFIVIFWSSFFLSFRCFGFGLRTPLVVAGLPRAGNGGGGDREERDEGGGEREEEVSDEAAILC